MPTARPDGRRRLPNTAGLHPAGLVEAEQATEQALSGGACCQAGSR
jgi:hypothetical protein